MEHLIKGSRVAKFFFFDPKLTPENTPPWKIVVEPSGIHESIEWFTEDPQCELTSEDECAFFFEDDEPIFYKDISATEIEPIVVDLIWEGAETDVARSVIEDGISLTELLDAANGISAEQFSEIYSQTADTAGDYVWEKFKMFKENFLRWLGDADSTRRDRFESYIKHQRIK